MTLAAENERKNLFADLERGRRTLLPEVVMGLGKDDETLLKAVENLLEKHPVLVTKMSPHQVDLLRDSFSEVVFDRKAGIGRVGGRWDVDVGRAMVISAGSSDYPVAEEASFSLEYLGLGVERAYDRGVAGVHRVFEPVETLRENPDMGVVVVAGMEGALPSFVAAEIPQPVVAVPTSVGYGSSFRGVAALLSMLNSCAPGVLVVNIDNGFGAAAALYKIMKMRLSRR